MPILHNNTSFHPIDLEFLYFFFIINENLNNQNYNIGLYEVSDTIILYQVGFNSCKLIEKNKTLVVVTFPSPSYSPTKTNTQTRN